VHVLFLFEEMDLCTSKKAAFGIEKQRNICARPLKKQGFIFQDHIRDFLTKRECTNTYISIQYYDI
jgi:hypothetical protein